MSCPLQAQSRCQDSETFNTCAARLGGVSAADRQSEEETAAKKITELKQVVDDSARVLAAKSTGAATFTINDFLPLLAALIDTGS
jgi:hypothetical protein